MGDSLIKLLESDRHVHCEVKVDSASIDLMLLIQSRYSFLSSFSVLNH